MKNTSHLSQSICVSSKPKLLRVNDAEVPAFDVPASDIPSRNTTPFYRLAFFLVDGGLQTTHGCQPISTRFVGDKIAHTVDGDLMRFRASTSFKIWWISKSLGPT